MRQNEKSGYYYVTVQAKIVLKKKRKTYLTYNIVD